jgi:hypothetical protein
MQNELLERKCDYCGERQTFQKGAPLTEIQAQNFKSWITLVWEIPADAGHGLRPMVRHGCRTTCAENILRTFDPEAAIREEEESRRRDDRPILVGQA